MSLVAPAASPRDAAAVFVRDWREADPGVLRPCYDAEQQHWRRELAWDTSWMWSTVERGRVTWGLPGLIAVGESGEIRGWTFWMVESGTLNVGGLIASSEAAAFALLDGILDAAAHAAADATSFFILDRAPGLGAALRARAFDLEPFLYLSLPLPGPGFSGTAPSYVASGFSRPGDVASGFSRPAYVASGFSRTFTNEVASLLRRSYAPGAAVHFAPHGTAGEWARYASGLVQQRACGVFDPHATRAVRDEAGLQALALMTSISPDTAHLAQLAVRPDCRGQRLAATLLEEACGIASDSGKTTMTLLVGESNSAARRLYESRGFTPRATFIAARRVGVAGPAEAGRYFVSGVRR